jgi:hypothetical protein
LGIGSHVELGDNPEIAFPSLVGRHFPVSVTNLVLHGAAWPVSAVVDLTQGRHPTAPFGILGVDQSVSLIQRHTRENSSSTGIQARTFTAQDTACRNKRIRQRPITTPIRITTHLSLTLLESSRRLFRRMTCCQPQSGRHAWRRKVIGPLVPPGTAAIPPFSRSRQRLSRIHGAR